MRDASLFILLLTITTFSLTANALGIKYIGPECANQNENAGMNIINRYIVSLITAIKSNTDDLER